MALRSSCDVIPEDALCCGLIYDDDISVDLPEFCDSLDEDYSLEDLTFIMGKYLGLDIEPSAPLPGPLKDIGSQSREQERLRKLKEAYISCFSALAARVALSICAPKSEIELSRKPVNAKSDHRYRETAVSMFTDMSPLCTSLGVRPDFWIRMGDIPLLLIEIVSGSQGRHSVKQTLLKSICKTIDQLRLYKNSRDERISEVSSIVLPKSRGMNCGAVLVTVKFGIDDQWKFRLSFRKIAVADVAKQMETIIESNCAFLSTSMRSAPWYLLKFDSLPPGMQQHYSKHSIVLKDFHQNGKVRYYYKFSPRSREREQLSDLLLKTILAPEEIKAGPLDGEKRVAVLPVGAAVINGLKFFRFPAVEPPLSNTPILRCFSQFAIQSALGLRALHVYDQIAHLDVRTFNTCFLLAGKENSEQAKIVFIDLDRSTQNLDSKNRVSTVGAQYVKPPEWPNDVPFSARNCDWRQWALMLWSVLKPADEEIIYNGEINSSGQPFLDSILSGTLVGLDTKSDTELVSIIQGWLQSPDFGEIKPVSAEFDSTTLTDQVPENSFSADPAAASDEQPLEQVILARPDANA